MSGVRVTGIPDEVTEKQLKAHFSSPKHGGGPVKQVFYPLQDNGAVILFESPSVMMDIFKHRHQLGDKEVRVTSLPRQIYRRGEMDLEKGVSVALSFNRTVIDELQYIGNLKVDFDYSQECYVIKGTWYQMEWALHLLDRTLDSMEGIDKGTKGPKAEEKQSKEIDTRLNSPEKAPLLSPSPTLESNSREKTLLRSPSPTLESNSPMGEPFIPGFGATGYTDPTFKAFFDEDDLFPREVKYRADKHTQGRARKHKNKNVLQTKHGENKNVKGPAPAYVGDKKDTKKGPRGLGISFGRGTDFTENKPRPKRQVPAMTTGIDVALTDFGEKRLSFDFELNKCLKVEVVKADITKQKTDGIVSPNTPDLSNSYGISSAIAKAAGQKFQAACYRHVVEHGPLEMADIAHMDAGGNLKHHVGFILNTAGPGWHEKDSVASMHFLVCTYLNCFQYAETVLWLKSLSTPLISAGAYGFPLDSCIQAFFDALLIHVTHVGQSPHLQEVQLVCFDSDSAGATIMILQSLLEVDMKHSESAALDRYHTGCKMYNFHAKLLKDDMLDDSVDLPKDVKQSRTGTTDNLRDEESFETGESGEEKDIEVLRAKKTNENISNATEAMSNLVVKFGSARQSNTTGFGTKDKGTNFENKNAIDESVSVLQLSKNETGKTSRNKVETSVNKTEQPLTELGQVEDYKDEKNIKKPKEYEFSKATDTFDASKRQSENDESDFSVEESLKEDYGRNENIVDDFEQVECLEPSDTSAFTFMSNWSVNVGHVDYNGIDQTRNATEKTVEGDVVKHSGHSDASGKLSTKNELEYVYISETPEEYSASALIDCNVYTRVDVQNTNKISETEVAFNMLRTDNDAAESGPDSIYFETESEPNSGTEIKSDMKIPSDTFKHPDEDNMKSLAAETRVESVKLDDF